MTKKKSAEITSVLKFNKESVKMMHDDQLKCHPRGSPPLCANGLFSLSKMNFDFGYLNPLVYCFVLCIAKWEIVVVIKFLLLQSQGSQCLRIMGQYCVLLG